MRIRSLNYACYSRETLLVANKDITFALLDGRISELKAFPPVAMKLLELCSDPDVQLSTLAQVVESDQVVAARVLRAANSAYYSPASRISSIRDALMLMGLDAVRALALTIGLHQAFCTESAIGREAERLWQHSIAVALCAQELARRCGERRKERCFALGLLHDIGKLALLQHLSKDYGQALRLCQEGLSLLEAERTVFGVDHAAVGGWLAERWAFPSELRLGISLHHSELGGSPVEGSTRTLAELVQVADWLASSQGLSAPGWSCSPATIPSCRASLPVSDDALLQVCLGLDKRVNQICAGVGIAPVPADLFQRTLYRASAELAQVALELDARNRRLQDTLRQVSLVGEVAKALAAADRPERVIELFISRLVQVQGVVQVRCVVDDSEAEVLAAVTGAGQSEVPQVRRLSPFEASRIAELPALPWQWQRRAFALADGRRGWVAWACDPEAPHVPSLDLFAELLVLALERAFVAAEALRAVARADKLARAGAAGQCDELTCRARAEAQNVGRAAAETAHELNNTLAIILGQAQLALAADGRPQLEAHLLAIEHAAQAAAAAVRRLQECARGVRGRTSMRPCDLAEIARSVLEATRYRWEQAAKDGITIRVVADLPAPLPVFADEGALRQVLTNLLFNAVDALPRGGTIRVRGWADAGFVYLVVEDTGVGIPADLKERIFEPYFTTKGEKGTGLGLAVCRSIVQEHRGEIVVHSEPGKGSAFTIRLPAFAGRLSEEGVEGVAKGASRLRILVVDDEPEVLEVLQRMLMLDGHAVQVARNGAAAVETARSGALDLVVTDLGLPDMHGWQVIAELRRANPRAAVLVVTGWDEQAREDAAELADAILTKPFGIQELRRAIGAALSRRPPSEPNPA